MKSLCWFATFSITGVLGQNCTDVNVLGGNQDTGGTCMGANLVSESTLGSSFASMGNYLAGSGALACDDWRGNTTCVDGHCMCAEAGVCAVNGQCGGLVGDMTCGGTANGAPCMFPFTYLDIEYNECTEVDNAGSPWCMVAGGMQWGNCNCMTDDCVDNSDFVDALNYTCSQWDGFYCPGARMYGYNSTGIEAILENCPLTCKVCFPPPETPGQGQTLVFKVTGSISFTIPSSDEAAFLDSVRVRTALANAIDELAGDLALGVEIADLVGGDEVEGLTVFCTESDCDDAMVLKLDVDLPSSCAGSVCTSTECCTSPPNCTATACDASSATHVIKTSLPTACHSAECMLEECCDFRADCSSFTCPSTHVMDDDTPLCQLANCTQSECCVAKGTCDAALSRILQSSGGPSSGPVVLSESWAGCPFTHVAKGAYSTITCDDAECTIDECCDWKDFCNATDCDESSHVPRTDRDGQPCELVACTVDECCLPRDTCASADCAAISSTHAPVTPFPLCWNAECTESECCDLRDSCEASDCTGANDEVLKENPPLCAGLTCTADDCCELNFDGYKRTTTDYLDGANLDGGSSYGPAAAIARCSSGDVVGCAGVTCDITAGGMATNPCYLKGVGATGSGAKIGFVSVACAVADCSANFVLKGDDLPEACAGPCDEAQCCDPKQLCADVTCPASHVDDPSAPTRCDGAACLTSECCVLKDTCEAADCTEATHLPKVAIPLYCAGTNCLIDECCDARAECTAEVCGHTHIIRPPFMIEMMGRCAGVECTIGECCNPKDVCMESICSDLEVYNVQVALCAGTQCESDECCSTRATCDAEGTDPCGDTHVLRPAEARVERCLTDECTPEECCEPRGVCSAAACNSDSTLMADLPSLCAGAVCTSDECCEVCPFEGPWRSTGVFGGDMNILMGACDTCVGECTSGWEVQMASMPSVAFCFEISAGCACNIALDELTLAAGQMSDSQDAISWDMILNNDLWESQAGSRRLDDKHNKPNYEIKDGRLIVFPQERRLQQTNIRCDFEVDVASPADALAVSGTFQELALEDIEAAISEQLALTTNFTIGTVYQLSEVETEQRVETVTTMTSGGVMSAGIWTWLRVSAIGAAVFFT